MNKNYKVIRKYIYPNGDVLDVGDILDKFNRPVAYINWLVSEGYIEEVVERPSSLLGAPVNDGSPTPYSVTRWFSSAEDMHTFAKWSLARTNLMHAAHRISGGTNGFVKGKDNFSCEYNTTEFYWSMTRFEQSKESFLYFRTEEQAQQFAKECGDDYKTYLSINK